MGVLRLRGALAVIAIDQWTPVIVSPDYKAIIPPCRPWEAGWMACCLCVCVRGSEVPKYLRYWAGLRLGPGLEMPAVTNT